MAPVGGVMVTEELETQVVVEKGVFHVGWASKLVVASDTEPRPETA